MLKPQASDMFESYEGGGDISTDGTLLQENQMDKNSSLFAPGKKECLSILPVHFVTKGSLIIIIVAVLWAPLKLPRNSEV